jgi:hypothetical protein
MIGNDMKYIEELKPGNSFLYKDNYYIITIDFKSDNKRLCYSLKNGQPLWFEPDSIVDDIQLYTIDKENNILPIIKTEKINDKT